MKAGREMDTKVAEFMGWESQYIEYGGAGGEYVWVMPNGKWQHEPDVPEYSTDIKAAWLVVEKMRERSRIEIIDDGMSWVVGLHDLDVLVSAPTAPEAICLAALAAVDAGR